MNVKSEDIGGATVFCNDTHKFGTDAVFLADFAFSKKSEVICDLGCGCGIIPLLMLMKNPNLKVTAVDIQPDAIELTKKAIEKNKLQNHLFTVLSDLKSMPSNYNNNFDLVTMNPPYKKARAGVMSGKEGLNIARFELLCTFSDITKTAVRLLKTGGRFCVCHRPERLADVIYEFRNYKIEAKRLRLVYQRSGLEPMLILVEGIKGASPGIKIMPDLIIENQNGEITDEVKNIYTPWYIEKEMV